METKTSPPPAPKAGPAHLEPPRKGRPLLWVFAVILVVALIAASFLRARDSREVQKATGDLATPSVHVVAPKMASAHLELVLPGNVQPYADTPIFSRTDGYVKRWLVDIGAVVKEGDLLAEIDSPEHDQQLEQAQASATQAEANLKLAQLTADRWKMMLQHDTVSKQDSDEKEGQLEADRASFASAQADVRRLQRLKSFEKIVAPFAGRIATRDINVGDLVSAGSMSSNTELFRVVQDDTLRIFVHVPEVNADSLTIGQPANIELASSPGHMAQGQVAHLAGAIDSTSRTLLAEIQVPNANHALMAGGYAKVHLPLPNSNRTFTIPANTLLFRPEGTVAGVVGVEGKVRLQTVEIGRDFGTEVEITKGLSPTDKVIINPSDSLADGDQVRVE